MKKEIERYLKFENIADVKFSKKDLRMIEKDLTEWITQKIFSKKYRGSKIDIKNRDFIKEQISYSISENKPIFLIPMFGGYKHFWNKNAPEVDFAELFVFENMTKWLAPILKVYKPGIILEFESEDITIPLVDNYPEEDLERYTESFNNLIKVFKKFAPENLEIRLMKTEHQYSLEKILEEMEKVRPKFEEEFFKKSDEEIDQLIKVASTNFRFDGKVDYTGLNDEEKRKKIIESNINNKIFLEADFGLREDYFLGKGQIPIVFTWGLGEENIDNWFVFKTTPYSFVDFWIGTGVLEKKEERFLPKVLSKTQYERISDKLRVIKVDSNFDKLKNFNQVEVYEG